MMRVRLKADGRIVEILADGSEQPLPHRLAAIAQQMRGGGASAAPAALAGSAAGAEADAA